MVAPSLLIKKNHINTGIYCTNPERSLTRLYQTQSYYCIVFQSVFILKFIILLKFHQQGAIYTAILSIDIIFLPFVSLA